MIEELLELRELADWREKHRREHPELGDDDRWRSDYDDQDDDDLDTDHIPTKKSGLDPLANELFIGISI